MDSKDVDLALVDRVTATLMDAWEGKERQPVGSSSIPTFASMARAVIEQYDLKEPSGDADSDE